MRKHIVDILIEERASRLMASLTGRKLVRNFFYPILRYREAVRTIDTVSSMTALSAFNHLAESLQLRISLSGLKNIPSKGSVIVVANHPTGIADGIAIFQVLAQIRKDITFFANRDALRASPSLSEMLIPVEWVDAKRTVSRNKETLKAIMRAIRSKRLIVIFPSGRLAKPSLLGLKERRWSITPANLARKYNIPLIPVHIKARNSWVYYLLCFLNTELKDMCLFRELVNKKNQPYRLTIGPPFEMQDTTQEATTSLRRYVLDVLGRLRKNHPIPGDR